MTYRLDTIKALTAYTSRQFRNGTTSFAVFVDGQSLVIEISCHNLNFKNFWGGEWLSKWTVDLNSKSISGSIKVHNHYFEQGNIQINLNKDVASSNLTNFTAKAIVDFVDKTETKVVINNENEKLTYFDIHFFFI